MPKKKKSAGTRVLLVGTAKGAFLFTGDAARKKWKLHGPFFLGQRVHDFRLDPRDGKTMLLSATGGHLGPTLYRSGDRGKSWSEAKLAPRFGTLPRGKKPGAVTGSRGFTVKTDFFLTPGHPDEDGTWYCGTSPSGLFRSGDGGVSWKGVAGFNERPTWWTWTNGGAQGSPEGALLHSILVDPRDAEHLFVSMSSGGTFESFDAGRHWKALNKGVRADFLPDKYPEFGQDPHSVLQHPADPDRLYQQNHCGLYRLDRARSDTWERIGDHMPKAIGDIGFPVVGHPSDVDTIWTFPMDGTQLWPRTSPGAKPAVYRTRDGGAHFERLDGGLPRENAWFTVFRQAMAADDDERRTGIYFGTTSGELWSSRDGGEGWSVLARHLPRIHSVRVARLR